MKFFEIEDDRGRRHRSRWELGSVYSASGKVDEWVFTVGKKYHSKESLSITCKVGHPQDLTMGAYDMPVVSSTVANILNRYVLLDVQLIPVSIDGYELGGQSWYIVNALRTIPCLDEKRSVFEKYKKADGQSDDDEGYQIVSKLVVNSNGLKDRNMFRIKGWDVPLIVSETIRYEFERASVTGILYSRV